MKQVYIAFIILLITFEIIGQTSLNWSFAIGSKKSDNIGGSIIDLQGNTLSVLYARDTVDVDPSSNSKLIPCLQNGSVLLNKYDKMGKFIWSKHFVDSTSVSILPVFVYTNNDILVSCFFTKNLYIDNSVILQLVAQVPDKASALLRMNDNGDIKWIKTYHCTDGAAINGVQKTEGGNFLFHGNYNGKLSLKDNIELPSSSRTDAFIGIMDSVGNVLNYKLFSSSKSDYITNIINSGNNKISFGILVDTSIVLSVRNELKVFNTSKNSAYVFGTMNNNLEIQSAHIIESTEGVEAENLLLDEELNYYICGYFDGTIQFDAKNPSNHKYTTLAFGDAFIVKYDRDGKVMWVNIYRSRAYAGFYQLKLINGFIYSNGGFNTHIDLDPGVDSISVNNRNGTLLIKLDKNGKLIWHNEFFSNDISGITSFNVGPTNEITCYGFFNSQIEIDPSNKDYYLKPVNNGPADAFLFSLKETHPTGVDKVQANESIFSVNQTGTQLVINSNSRIESLNLYDLQGNVLYTKDRIDSHSALISKESFSSGIYFIHGQVNGKHETKKILLIR